MVFTYCAIQWRYHQFSLSDGVHILCNWIQWRYHQFSLSDGVYICVQFNEGTISFLYLMVFTYCVIQWRYHQFSLSNGVYILCNSIKVSPVFFIWWCLHIVKFNEGIIIPGSERQSMCHWRLEHENSLVKVTADRTHAMMLREKLSHSSQSYLCHPRTRSQQRLLQLRNWMKMVCISIWLK